MRLDQDFHGNIHLFMHYVILLELNINGTQDHPQQLIPTASSSADRLGSVPPPSMTQGKPPSEPQGVDVIMIKHLTIATTKHSKHPQSSTQSRKHLAFIQNLPLYQTSILTSQAFAFPSLSTSSLNPPALPHSKHVTFRAKPPTAA